MARKGIRRTHTGCVTCKKRRIKCDEAHPSCVRCTSTGRKCDGYQPWIPKSLQRVQPSVIPGAGATDFRSLSFLRQVMAPTFAGPLPESFWTNDIPQVAHQEPAVFHAVVALSSLFEASRGNSQTSAPQKRFAISRYSIALRQVVASEVQHMDSIAMVSYVFMGIELLLNNYKGALNHYYHGRSLLESYNLSTKILGLFQRIGVFMMLLNILGLFQRLNVVALHFSHFASLSPKKDALVWTPDGPFKDLGYAEGALDWLAYRSMKLTMRLYASSSQPDPSLASTDLLSITQMQQSLSRELDDWSLAVTHLIASKDNCPSKGDVYRMLQARWSVCKVLAGIGESSRTTNEASRKVGRLAEIISSAIGDSASNTSHEGWEGWKVDYNYLRMAAEVNEKFLQEFGHTRGRFIKLPDQTIGQSSKSYLDQKIETLPY